MDALRGIAAHLNTANAEASAIVQAVDQYLGEELCVGVTAASRPFDSQRVLGENERELIVTSHLAFGKVQGKDRVYILKATLEKNEWKEGFTKIVAEDRTPWGACPREVRLQSFAMLPELLANLAARVAEVAQQTARTVETVRGLVEIMKQPPLPSPPRVPDVFVNGSESESGSDNDGRDENAEEHAEPADVPLQELTISTAPNLFKRPRSKV
jgi:hypothetical protein